MRSGPSDPGGNLHMPAPLPSAQGICDYCGLPLTPRNRVQRPRPGARDAVAAYCCHGCAFIAEQLALLPAAPGAAPAAQAPDGAPPLTPTCTQLSIDGMVCSACALLIEHQLRLCPGVCSASVDYVAHRALVVYDPQRTDTAQLRARILAAGYHVPDASDAGAERRKHRVELLRVLLAWLGMMQVMMLAAPSYLAADGTMAPDIAQMLRIGQLVLSVPVALFCAAPFWRAALSQLRVGVIGMDVPVALGLASALGASALATLAGTGAVYYDSVTMFIALLLAVRWWQMRALARTAALIDAAARQTQLRAQRLRGRSVASGQDSVAAESLRPGDCILVPPGEAVAADGRIIDGSTSVSQSWLTGESLPLEKSVGEAVLAGSLNLDQAIIVQVTRAGDATSLAALQRLIIDAAARRPAGADLAQRVARYFALAVLGLAALTVVYWLNVDPSSAMRATIAVLVVTCPCALSLAAPLAGAVAQAALAARGVLLTRPAALEALAQVDTVAMDKTGTLTAARPRLVALEPLGRHGYDRCLRIAAGLETRSRHPFAQALAQAARERALAPATALRVGEVPGVGVEGVIDGRRYRLGKAEYALALAPAAAGSCAVPAARHAAASHIVLADEDGPCALLGFSETLRDGAADLVRALAADGRRLMLISGDTRAAVEQLVRTLGPVPQQLECHADQSPSGKRQLLEARQHAGHRVAMIGDGINDAPILAQADASIALASGSRLAQVRADIVVIGDSLAPVQGAFIAAARTTRVVRQNLAWALGYNVVMVPLAALGMLAPWLAAVGMAASSAFVLANSLRLRDAGGQRHQP